jgi:hypothetical protein
MFHLLAILAWLMAGFGPIADGAHAFSLSAPTPSACAAEHEQGGAEHCAIACSARQPAQAAAWRAAPAGKPDLGDVPPFVAGAPAAPAAARHPLAWHAAPHWKTLDEIRTVRLLL